MVEESYGVCSKCGKEDILGDGLCVDCWDAKEGGVDQKKAIRDNLFIDHLLGFDKAVGGTSKEAIRAYKEDSEEVLRVIDKMLLVLTDRQRRVIVLRFGLEDGGSYTLETIGQEFKVTRERIRQIEAKALRRLWWQVHFGSFRKLRTYLGNDAPTTLGGVLLKGILGVRRKHT